MQLRVAGPDTFVSPPWSHPMMASFHLAGHFSTNQHDPLYSHLFLDDRDANPLSVADPLDIKGDLVPCPGFPTSSPSSLPNKLTPSGIGGGKPLPSPAEYGDTMANSVECFKDVGTMQAGFSRKSMCKTNCGGLS